IGTTIDWFAITQRGCSWRSESNPAKCRWSPADIQRGPRRVVDGTSALASAHQRKITVRIHDAHVREANFDQGAPKFGHCELLAKCSNTHVEAEERRPEGPIRRVRQQLFMNQYLTSSGQGRERTPQQLHAPDEVPIVEHRTEQQRVVPSGPVL